MSKEQIECRGILLKETANAMQVQKAIGRASYWLPRSQIGYCRKERDPNSCEVKIIFTIPEWLAEKQNLWEMVTS